VSLVTRTQVLDNDPAFDRRASVRFGFVRADVAMALLLGAAASGAQTAKTVDGPDDVMQSDRDFAALAQVSDVRSAFEQYLADDAVLFRPLPERGRDWLESHEPANGTLDWAPAGALVACDRSLAVTIGTWRYTAPGTRTVEAGQYLTAWRHDDAEGWRIVLDEAVAFDSVAALATRLRSSTRTSCSSGGPHLAKLDAAESLANGAIALQAPPGAAAPHLQARQLGAFKGGGADIAITYGEVTGGAAADADEDDVRAVYVRVWQRFDANWTLVIDAVSPVAP
jgi:ketosteroid isomerase-like protein